MDENLMNVLRCPYCGGSLELSVYERKEGEIKEGIVLCRRCKKNFKIRDYILSFLEYPLVNDAMVKEGDFWGMYYAYLYKIGVMNFIDVKAPFSPFYWIYPEFKIEFAKRIEMVGATEMRAFQNDEYRFLVNHQIVNDMLRKGRKRVLEVGCGSGWLSLELCRKGFDVIGIDPAFEALKVAKEYSMSLGYRIEFINSPFLPIFKPGTFDFIFAFHTLHHIPHLKQAVKVMGEILKRDGIIVVYDHSGYGPIESLISLLRNAPLSLLLRIMRKNRYRPTMSGSSPCENISPVETRIFNGIFEIMYQRHFLHLLDWLPSLCLLLFPKKPEIVRKSAHLKYLVEEGLKAYYHNFVLIIGKKKSELNQHFWEY
jgi:SAM-dependent methyltransferase/uncharacterized protein YbaR (Trm112 family)